MLPQYNTIKTSSCCLPYLPLETCYIHSQHSVQAENVVQLINARTATAADSALAGLQGGLGQLVSTLRQDVLEILAELEARLDFDEDLPPMDVQALVQDITGRLQKPLMVSNTIGRQFQG